jgi:hypothetical protein
LAIHPWQELRETPDRKSHIPDDARPDRRTGHLFGILGDVEYLCLALDSRTWHVGIVEEDGRAEDEDDVVAREPCGELLLGRGRCPWKSGWPWGKLASGEMGSCQTGAASFSASVTAS